MSFKPLPKINIQGVVHYAMPENKEPGTVAKHTICSISTMIPGRRVPDKKHLVTCRACLAIAKQVHIHRRRTYAS